MSKIKSSYVLQAVVLLAVGSLIGVANNLVAGPARQIDWVTDYPEVSGSSCPESLEPDAGDGGSPDTISTNGGPTPTVAPDPPAENVIIPDKPPDVASVNVDTPQARLLHEDGVLFVDARLTHQFEEGHIPGATSLPVFEGGVDQKVMKLAYETLQNPTAPIVVYCNGGTCEDSHMLAEKLWLAGCQRVYVYEDGYPGWLGAGLPTENGGGS